MDYQFFPSVNGNYIFYELQYDNCGSLYTNYVLVKWLFLLRSNFSSVVVNRHLLPLDVFVSYLQYNVFMNKVVPNYSRLLRGKFVRATCHLDLPARCTQVHLNVVYYGLPLKIQIRSVNLNFKGTWKQKN